MTSELSAPSLEKAFTISLLLTGSMHSAETAVLNTIAQVNPDGLTERALFTGTIRASVELLNSSAVQTSSGQTQSLPALPVELQEVSRLDTEPRCCFVARILAGLPNNLCASLLQLELQQVTAYTSSAIQSLTAAEERRVANDSSLERTFSETERLHKTSKWAYGLSGPDVLAN